MKTNIRRFQTQLLYLSIVLGVIVSLLMLFSQKNITPTLPFLLIFHIAATLLSYLFISNRVTKGHNKFINAYLSNTTVKLLLYLVILMVYSLNYISDAVNFIMSFFVLYIIFTIFEVYHLVILNKKNPLSESNN